MYQTWFKPLIDFLLALLILALSSPFWILTVLLLLRANRGAVFFVQERPGLHGKPFRLLKFKTMNDRTDEQGNLLPDKERLTVTGKIVRKTSLDELPQLVNVLKGDISLVGPRPLLMEYLPLYTERQARRHEVKPGITGLAQVKGRNAISWEAKFEYDVQYVENISFGLDLKIFFMTVWKVFKLEGVNASGEVPMEKFKGSKTESYE